jgi:hypothetical protein
VAGELPGVEIKPVVRHFDLIPIDNLLLENTISVPQAITPGRVVEGGQAVQEASSQSTKTAVSEGSIVLLTNDVLNTESEFSKAS